MDSRPPMTKLSRARGAEKLVRQGDPGELRRKPASGSADRHVDVRNPDRLEGMLRHLVSRRTPGARSHADPRLLQRLPIVIHLDRRSGIPPADSLSALPALPGPTGVRGSGAGTTEVRSPAQDGCAAHRGESSRPLGGPDRRAVTTPIRESRAELARWSLPSVPVNGRERRPRRSRPGRPCDRGWRARRGEQALAQGGTRHESS